MIWVWLCVTAEDPHKNKIKMIETEMEPVCVCVEGGGVSLFCRLKRINGEHHKAVRPASATCPRPGREIVLTCG